MHFFTFGRFASEDIVPFFHTQVESEMRKSFSEMIVNVSGLFHQRCVSSSVGVML